MKRVREGTSNMMTNRRLAGHSVLVAGASSGICLGIARKMAKEGAGSGHQLPLTSARNGGNPRLAEQQRRKPKPADPCAMVLFGATGDLAKRLVVPALYNLARSGTLPDNFALIGVARTESSAEGWKTTLNDALISFVGSPQGSAGPIDEEAWKRLADRISFVQGDLNDAALYDELHGALDAAEAAHGTLGNVIFYLAVADQLFGPLVEQLGKAKLTDQADDKADQTKTWRRVVIEKPFGHSLKSARALNAGLLKSLDETQIFRIDHFLGKDTVQAIIAFRFANGLFEPIWNRDHIDHVQITVAETLGVEKRGDFYEHAGALRDMVPNHILSLLTMVAMEPPTGVEAAAVRDKKADVLASIRPANPAKAVRGQYGAGKTGRAVKQAYRDEPDVAKDSKVETFAALELEIDNWRWAGVPFFVRTGKNLAGRMTEIAIRFKQAPYSLFKDTPTESLSPNWLVIRIAPDEGISLQFEVKRRGPVVELAPVEMEFNYDDWFEKQPNVGYETLLYDVMIGDPTLFMRADMAEHGWRIVEPVLKAWAKEVARFPNYASGSEGPRSADNLIAADGKRTWRSITGPSRRPQ
jgi:glucose-6-phosphate 1-dehydrogenase